jgi:hypothetical protein
VTRAWRLASDIFGSPQGNGGKLSAIGVILHCDAAFEPSLQCNVSDDKSALSA